MKARFEVWRVLEIRDAYSPAPYGCPNVSTAIRITQGFAPNHFGHCVWVALLPSREAW